MRSLRLLIFALLFLGTPALAPAQTGGLVGRWLTEDKKGVINIGHCGEMVCGAIDWMKPDPAKIGAPHDEHNPNPNLRDRLLCGLAILYDFKETEPNHWEGLIYSPEDGQVYKANMRLDGPDLKLRGYVGISLLGVTQTWTHADPSFKSCRAG
jgi:uncharacterized protein (DUF2147 family)